MTQIKSINFGTNMRLLIILISFLGFTQLNAQSLSVQEVKEAVKDKIKSEHWLNSIDESSIVYLKETTNGGNIALVKILRLKKDGEVKEVKRTGQFLMEKGADKSNFIITFLEYAPIDSFDFLGEVKTKLNYFIIFYEINEEGIVYYIRDLKNNGWYKTELFQENVRLDYLNIDLNNSLIVYYLGSTDDVKEGRLVKM